MTDGSWESARSLDKEGSVIADLQVFEIANAIEARHSSRMPFDSERLVPDRDLQRILEAARWAPTPHNMQNFEVIVVDDPDILEKIAAVRSTPSETFLRENYQQLSFSEDELLRNRTGLLATMFPSSWRTPDAIPGSQSTCSICSLGRHCKTRRPC